MMWLSGLHIPESYLTALVQATCRRNEWPLDKSTLYTSVTEVRLNQICCNIITSWNSCEGVKKSVVDWYIF